MHLRQGRPEDLQRIVGRSINDKDRLKGTCLGMLQGGQSIDQVGDRISVPVDRDDDRVADGAHRMPTAWNEAIASATRSISPSVNSGKHGSVTISATARSVSI